MRKQESNWEVTVYRLFLLSILFAVLWAKEYLWTAFCLALLLYVSSLFFIPMLIEMSSMQGRPPIPIPTPEPMPAGPSRQRRSASPAPAIEEDEEPAAESNDDFREPRPSRSPPRRKSP